MSKYLYGLLITISLICLGVSECAFAERWAKDKDINVMAVFTDDYIESSASAVVIVGSGLKDISIKINNGIWSTPVPYDLTVPVVEDGIMKYQMILPITLPHGGANTVYGKTTDNVGWESDAQELRMNIDSKKPVGKIKTDDGVELQ